MTRFCWIPAVLVALTSIATKPVSAQSAFSMPQILHEANVFDTQPSCGEMTPSRCGSATRLLTSLAGILVGEVLGPDWFEWSTMPYLGGNFVVDDDDSYGVEVAASIDRSCEEESDCGTSACEQLGCDLASGRCSRTCPCFQVSGEEACVCGESCDCTEDCPCGSDCPCDKSPKGRRFVGLRKGPLPFFMPQPGMPMAGFPPQPIIIVHQFPQVPGPQASMPPIPPTGQMQMPALPMPPMMPMPHPGMFGNPNEVEPQQRQYYPVGSMRRPPVPPTGVALPPQVAPNSESVAPQISATDDRVRYKTTNLEVTSRRMSFDVSRGVVVFNGDVEIKLKGSSCNGKLHADEIEISIHTGSFQVNPSSQPSAASMVYGYPTHFFGPR